MAENDPVALKRAYHALFDSIVIGPEDEKGVRPISYILKNWDGSFEDINRLSDEMVDSGFAKLNPLRPQLLYQFFRISEGALGPTIAIIKFNTTLIFNSSAKPQTFTSSFFSHTLGKF